MVNIICSFNYIFVFCWFVRRIIRLEYISYKWLRKVLVPFQFPKGTMVGILIPVICPQHQEEQSMQPPQEVNWKYLDVMHVYKSSGTKFVYNRDALLMLAKSPLSREPPNLPKIPGVTAPAEESTKPSVVQISTQDKKTNPAEHEELFDMDNWRWIECKYPTFVLYLTTSLLYFQRQSEDCKLQASNSLFWSKIVWSWLLQHSGTHLDWGSQVQKTITCASCSY